MVLLHFFGLIYLFRAGQIAEVNLHSSEGFRRRKHFLNEELK